MADERRALLASWLDQDTPFSGSSLTVASADASFWRYFRIHFEGKNYSKPNNKNEAKSILKLLNNNKHFLHSAVCVSRGGSMITNFHESCPLKVKNLTDKAIDEYIERLDEKKMLKYGVYQIEAGGLDLFEDIHDDMEAIMGLPMKQLKIYLNNLK